MSVDSRIVTMKFDNAAFERGAAQTMSTMEKLKSLLGFQGASKGLSEVQGAADKFNLNSMEGSVTGISKSWLAMATVAITALANITSRAVDAGIQLGKSFTVDPIKQGLDEYGLKLNSVQTIMAATGDGTKKVTAALTELNDYSDKTIYSFRDMIENIPKFTNAGVGLNASVKAIQGIAQVAAVSGANTNEAARAMYNFGQALSQGSVKLIDWKSIEIANMGTTEFKQQLIDTAVEMGTLTKEGEGLYKTLEGNEVTTKNFSTTLQDQWLTSKALTKTLAKYTDETTALGKKAYASATDIKTLSQLMGVFKEQIGSGWAQSFELIFGSLDEAKKLWGGVNDAVGGFIQRQADARNQILGDWNALGGRADLIEGIKNIFEALASVITPIKNAFRDIFPAMTGQRLFELTENLREFTEGLKVSGETSENLRRTFRGVFAIFSIIGQVIKGVFGVFTDLFGVVNDGTGTFLNFTGGIGDFLVSLDEAIKKGGGLTKFFEGLSSVLSVPVKLIQALSEYFIALFDGASTDGMASSLGELGDALTPLEALGERVSGIFSGLSGLFRRVGDAIAPFADMVKDAISSVSDAIQNAFSGGNFDKTLDAINTGLFAGLVLLFRKFVNGGLSGLLGGGKGGVMGAITGAFDGLTNTLGAMQANLKANTLLKIAGAVALLTVSIVALSLIDSEKLTKAMTALAVGFGQLLTAMTILEKITSATGFIKMPFITASLILLAGAMTLLAAAVKIFSTMDWDELLRGLTGTAASLGIIAGAMKIMPKSLPVTGAGLILVGAGLAAVAGAMKLMGKLSWEEMGKGLASIAGALTLIAVGMNMMPLTLPVTAAGLILVGVGLTAVAGAMKLMGSLKWSEMGKGLAGVAGALVIIAGAMNLMPVSLPVTAAGLVLVGIALAEIAAVAKIFATMSWEEMSKAAVALAGALGILAGGLTLMTGSLAGAAALLVAAGALAVLTPVLVTLGGMSWEGIAKGLTALAGAFVVLGLAGVIIGPLTPVIMGLSVALLALGAGLALAGVGALAFATAFGIVVSAGAAGAAVLTAILDAIIESIPKALAAFGRGLIEFAKVIATGGPAFTKAFVAVMDSLLDAVIKITPKIGTALLVLVRTGLRVLRAAVPDMVSTGFDLLMGVLRGIRDNIQRIVKVSADIITRFLKALGDEIPRMLDAGAQLILDFITGLADAVRKYDDQLIDAGVDLGGALVTGMLKGLAAGPSKVASAAFGLGKTAISSIAKAIDSHSPSKEAEKLGKYVGQGFAKGLIGGKDDVQGSVLSLRDMLKQEVDETKREIDSLEKELSDLKKADKRDEKAIAKAQKKLDVLKTVHENSKAAHKVLMKDMKEERGQLYILGQQYDTLGKQIEDAKNKLKEAIKVRDDAQANITAQYTRMPSIAGKIQDAVKAREDAEKAKADADKAQLDLVSRSLPAIERRTNVKRYKDILKKEAQGIETFLSSLSTLRSMGLDDASYKKFLDEGVSIQPFINELIAGGPSAVAEIDQLAANLGAATAKLNAQMTPESTQAVMEATSPLQSYKDSLLSEAQQNEVFLASLAQLRAMGLDDVQYKKFVEEGVTIQPFINELIASGPQGVAEINALSSRLGTAAANMGSVAAYELHQAGVNAAQGFLAGLESQEDALEKKMGKIANIIVKAVKKKLKIKSPSRVFDTLGKFTGQGFAQGLDKSSSLAEKSAVGVADSAFSAMKSSLSQISGKVEREVDMNPVIRPVLDLTGVTRDAAVMAKTMDKALVAEASYGQALSISSSRESAQSADSAVSAEGGTTQITFEQHNHSPKALSSVEIYRQTKNQLSLAKEALK